MPNFLATRWIVLIVALAIGLHLPAHLGKAPLPGDGPVFASNATLETTSLRSLRANVETALTRPEAAWDSATHTVARSRYRPVTTLSLLGQRALFGDAAVRGVAWVSLALHALLALLAAALVGRLRGPPAARLLAAVLVAACPAGLVAAAWPAQHGAVLGAVLGSGGVLLCLGAGVPRLLAGGLLLALAGLSHEVAFGLAPAALVLRPFVMAEARPEAPSKGAVLLLAPTALALGVRQWALGAASPADALGLGAAASAPLVERLFLAIFDAAAGVARCFAAVVWPARLTFADGPWQPELLGRAAGLALLMALVPFVVRRRHLTAGRAALAALVSLVAIALARFSGGPAFHDVHLYVVLPLVAATLGCTLTTLARSGGARRKAAVVAAALLVGSFVAGTVARAAAFRGREPLVERALAESDGSELARAWQLALALDGLPTQAEERRQALRDLDALAHGITTDVAPADLGSQLGDDVVAAPGGRDAETATYVAEPLLAHAQAVASSGVEDTDPVLGHALEATLVVTSLLPRDTTAWSTLAALRSRVGDVEGALDAATKAYVLGPGDRQASLALATAYLEIGSPGDAVFVLDRLHGRLLDEGRSVEPELRFFLASTLIADGRTLERIAGRTQHRFERALELLGPLESNLEFMARAKRMRYEAALLYGDFLASQDAPQLALLAYQEAIDVAGARGSAKAHRQWLIDRLAREEQAAREALARAQQGVGNVADALARLAIAFCRKGDFDEADALFAKLAESQGGMTPPLKFLYAKYRFGWSPDSTTLRQAITLLEEVLAEDADLHAAEYELAHLLERSGRPELALDKFRRVARRAYLSEIGLEAAEHAQRVEAGLEAP